MLNINVRKLLDLLDDESGAMFYDVVESVSRKDWEAASDMLNRMEQYYVRTRGFNYSQAYTLRNLLFQAALAVDNVTKILDALEGVDAL